MVYWAKQWLLLSLLTIVAFEQRFYPIASLAQSLPASEVCDSNEFGQSRQTKIAALLEQARMTLDNPPSNNTVLNTSDGEVVLRLLAEAWTLALQQQGSSLQVTRTQADWLQQWLLDANEGYPTTRLQRLIQQIEPQQNSTQLQTLLDQLDQLLQLSTRLTPATSYVKTRSLAAIARLYTDLGQIELAKQALERAQQAAMSIQGDVFVANSLIDVAEVYALIGEPQPTQAILAQVDQALQQIPPQTSEPIVLIILERMAATYANIGDYASAQNILAKLPTGSEAEAVAQRGIAEAYLAAENLEMAAQSIQAIGAVSQRVPALAHLAVAYHRTEQADRAMALLQEAVQLAQTPEVVRDPILHDALLKQVVEAYLQLGAPDAAFRLAQTASVASQMKMLQAVMATYTQAGQTDVVNQWLSERLSQIRSTPNDWEQRLYLGELLPIVAELQQFEWVRQEWSQIAAIDYGPQDWQLVSLAAAYARTGQYPEAVAWAQQLPLDNRPVLRVKLLTTIALQAYQGGETTWAQQLLQQIRQQIDPLVAAYETQFQGDLLERDRIKPKSFALLAIVYGEMGDKETMQQLLQQVIQLDVNMSDPSISAPIDHPFALLVEAEQYEGALQLAAGTANPELRESRLQTSATGLLRQNRFDLVLPVVEQLTAANQKTQLLLAIAQRYGELQQVDQALPILARAFQVAQTIPGEESQVDRLGTDGLTVVEFENDRGSLLGAIALQYAQLNQLPQALQVADRLQESQTRERLKQRIQCFVTL